MTDDTKAQSKFYTAQRVCPQAVAAMARAEEVNEARIAAEATLRASILDLKDQIDALNESLNAVSRVVDEHAVVLDDLRPATTPTLDPVILGLAMAWRATNDGRTREILVDAYSRHRRISGCANIYLDTYGLEGS